MNLETELYEERKFLKEIMQKIITRQKLIDLLQLEVRDKNTITNSEIVLTYLIRRVLFKFMLFYGTFQSHDKFISFLKEIIKLNASVKWIYENIFPRMAENQKNGSEENKLSYNFVKEMIRIKSPLFNIDLTEAEGLSDIRLNKIPIGSILQRVIETLETFQPHMIEKYYCSLIGYIYLKWFRNSAEKRETTKTKGTTYTPLIITKLMVGLSIKRLINERFHPLLDREKMETMFENDAVGSVGIDAMVGTTGMDAMGGATRMDAMGGATGMDALGGTTGMDAMGGTAGMDAMGGATGMDALGGTAGMDAMGGTAGMDAMGGATGMDALGGTAGMDAMGGTAGMDGIDTMDGMPLETLQKIYVYLSEITICDNACGCGVFLVQMLDVLYMFIEKITEQIRKNNEQQIQKKSKYEILKKSIFGVDADKESVDITRFLLLSACIKQNNGDSFEIEKEIEEINGVLKERIVCGDSLFGFPISNFELYGFLKDGMNEQDLKNNTQDLKKNTRGLKNKKQKYNVSKQEYNEHKQESHQDIDKLFDKVLMKKLDNRNATFDLEELKKNHHYRKMLQNKFHWNAQFFEIFCNEGFDLIIGNPPYVRQELLNLKFEPLELSLKDIFAAILNGIFDSDFIIPKTSDLSVLFLIRSLQLIKPNGFISYIITDKWMQRNYGEVYRKFLLEYTRIHDLIDLSQYSIFPEANIDPLIIILSRDHKRNGESRSIRYYKPKSLEHFVYQPVMIDTNQLSSNKWFFDTQDINPIKQAIEKRGTPIENTDLKIRFGIKTGFNEAFLIDGRLKETITNSNPDTFSLLKPVLRGRDIFPYRINESDRWLIYIPKGFTINRFKDDYIKHFNRKGRNDPMEDSIDLESVDVKEFFETKFSETYPELYNHLKSFEASSGRGRGLIERDDYGNFWWELRTCNYYCEYESPKIIWQEITKKPSFYFDVNGFYGLAKTFIMLSPQPKVHTLILNSTLSKWMIQWYGTTLKTTVEFKKRYVEKFPIVFAPESELKHYDLICDILQFLAQFDDFKPLFDYFYRIADILVFYLYFNDPNIDPCFRFQDQESMLKLFGIFERAISDSLPIYFIPKRRYNKTKNTKKNIECIKLIKELQEKITDLEMESHFIKKFEEWEPYHRLFRI